MPDYCLPPRSLLLVSLLATATVSFASDPSEGGYFTELPTVLTVTRLAQPIADTPGAVTIIDRETIRRSGAREITEVLRLAPGFLLHHMGSGARPVASYHASYGDIPRHLQVMIDGRSVYSSLLLGSSNNGLMGLVLEDIERIEILRGSNSASLGGNAFLGVVNIVTRHSDDVERGLVSLNLGAGGVRDGVARLARSHGAGSYRLTFAKRQDSGYENVHDDKQVEQVHFRADWQRAPNEEVMFTAGTSRYDWGVQTSLPAAVPRTETWDNSYFNLQWSRYLSETDAVKFSAQVDTERYDNFFPRLAANGTSRRSELEIQHTFALGNAWRFVWGGQYRHERVVSQDLFFDEPRQDFHVWRGFGNIEWKPGPKWVINLGGVLEHHSIAGKINAPRLMANYHVLPGHTVRFGETSAYRQPTLFESRADWRLGGIPFVTATGGVRAERIKATEFGYFGELRPLGLTIDIRSFREQNSGLHSFFRPCGGCPNDIVNKNDALQRGWETQLRWHVGKGTEIWANHTELRLIPATNSSQPQDRYRAPSRISSFAWFQNLPHSWEFSLIHYNVGSRFVTRIADMIPEYRQTDIRVGRKFSIGATRAEASLVIRAIGGGGTDYVESDMPVFDVGRRAHLSLSLEF